MADKKPVVVAIDGPAGSGKSTISKLVAKRLGLLYLDTGAMYRALTLKAMAQGVDLRDEGALIRLAEKTKIKLRKRPRRPVVTVLLDGKDVTRRIRTPEVTKNIKYVARVRGVRRCMVKLQRSIGSKSGAVLEGRDTTTVVFPRAPYKFYLDADLKARAMRRYKELRSLGIKVSLRAVRADAEARDSSDKTRKAGPLRRAKDARYIDTTKMSIDEVVERVLSQIKA